MKQRYGKINGVVHSAVGVLDHSLAKMEEERFRAGLSAKVDVSVRMAQVFAKEPLDFVLFFSSFGAFGKGLGQSSYASGCTFGDLFAHQLSHEWPCAVKVMNWGYWDGVGIASVIPDTLKNRLAQAGIGSIEPSDGMQALEVLLTGPVDQLAFMKTTKPLEMEGLQAGEEISIHRERHESSLENIKQMLPSLALPGEVAAASPRGATSPPGLETDRFHFSDASLVDDQDNAGTEGSGGAW
ncbi:KR domain-containing protein [Brevibacillus humidisoli]|uniref:KR domain-containing protein n=1 Tax=Brevibacillus humidisoli TaxID=2895522 RepID=UPI001E3B57A3|nr:KR domain-containing protein [Brevibacillus humidisoli]UFJ41785.1 KR domain-containing protein [Brevibacillus humidisoli]